MKKVEAIIKPLKLDAVKEALLGLGIEGMTFTEVRGLGHQSGQTELYRGAEYVVDALPKVKLEIVVPDARLEAVLDAVCQAAATGRVGDGKVFVLPVIEAVKIRTGGRGTDALS